MKLTREDALKGVGSEIFMRFWNRPQGDLGLYAPKPPDPQKPHTRDEIYVIASGTGTFVHAGERIPFGPGDALTVDAGVEHRFEDFSEDFSAWVIFLGPRPQ